MLRGRWAKGRPAEGPVKQRGGSSWRYPPLIDAGILPPLGLKKGLFERGVLVRKVDPENVGARRSVFQSNFARARRSRPANPDHAEYGGFLAPHRLNGNPHSDVKLNGSLQPCAEFADGYNIGIFGKRYVVG